MVQALAALLGAALTVAACYAAGMLVLQRLGATLSPPEKFPLGFVLGAACLHLVIFAVLALKLAYWPVLVALLAGVIAAALQTGALSVGGKTMAPVGKPLRILFGVVFGAFTVLYLFNAWAPEMSPDGSGYHLGLVARYLRAHGFERITTNVYATLSGGVDVLFVPAFAIGRHSAAALIHFSFAIALALAIFAYGRRIGKPWVGAAGALLTYLSPVVGIAGTSAYNDVAVAAIVFSVFYWLELWDASRDPRLLVPVGLLAGYCYAAKYTAAVMLIYALAFVLWRTRRIRPLLVTAACASVMIAPWAIKNWIYVRNPIAPFGNTLFRNPYVQPSFETEWRQYLGRYDVENKWTLPLEATVRGAKTAGVIGVTFLAAPLALAALRYRAGRRLMAPGLLLLLPYFANVGTRFLIPCLPFFSLSMALALAGSTPLLVLLIVFHAAASSPTGVKRYASQSWRLTRIPYKEALRRIPEDRYLRERFHEYNWALMIEAHVPEGERVLAISGIPEAYTSREVLVSYEGALNNVLTDIVNTGWDEGAQPTRRLAFRFPERIANRLRVVLQPSTPWPAQWSVHELRFFRDGLEVQRRPEWQLRAFPNPWDVRFAFDGSPATRWRSWETPWPGMYIEADFSRPEAVDEVRVETSPDSGQVRMTVEAADEQGQWAKVADQPNEEMLKVDASIRRATTPELRARGVNYLFIQDIDWGAKDFRGDPDSWGLSVVAAGSGGTLYKVNP
jgi:hypothetical protein